MNVKPVSNNALKDIEILVQMMKIMMRMTKMMMSDYTLVMVIHKYTNRKLNLDIPVQQISQVFPWSS